jgi:hypothetical protein
VGADVTRRLAAGRALAGRGAGRQLRTLFHPPEMAGAAAALARVERDCLGVVAGYTQRLHPDILDAAERALARLHGSVAAAEPPRAVGAGAPEYAPPRGGDGAGPDALEAAEALPAEALVGPLLGEDGPAPPGGGALAAAGAGGGSGGGGGGGGGAAGSAAAAGAAGLGHGGGSGVGGGAHAAVSPAMEIARWDDDVVGDASFSSPGGGGAWSGGRRPGGAAAAYDASPAGVGDASGDMDMGASP